MTISAFRSLVACLLVFGVAGCAHIQQQQALAQAQAYQQQGREQIRELVDRTVRHLQSAIEFAPIRDKVFLGRDVRETPLSILALQTTPIEEEEKALEGLQQFIVSSYYPQQEALLRTYAPHVVPINQLVRAASASLLAELYVGNITYGDYARKRIDLYSNFVAAVQKREEELRSQAIQQAQAQAQLDAQRAIATSVALQSFQTYLLGQRLLNQQFQPARIAPFTCTRYGNITNCF